jgi:SAM-dependent methyltransferase
MAGPNHKVAALFEVLTDTILAGATACYLDGSFVAEVGALVEQETTVAKSAEVLLAEAFHPSRDRLLDFGCGAAHHRPFIESLGYRWSGVDSIGSVSPTAVEAVLSRGDEIKLYDGNILPYGDGEFDVVYSMLVFHHVHHIDQVFSEIARVIRSGGKIIGQLASLEQMQDYQTFNFSPYGLKIAAAAAGLSLSRVYPKHDAFAFLLRRLMITLGAPDENEMTQFLDPDGYFQRNLIDLGARTGLTDRDVNLLRLKFCTHFVFEIQKP